ncbi:hypothetical protein ACFL1E_05820 [Candidatus Omnitrophota bacterium]
MNRLFSAKRGRWLIVIVIVGIISSIALGSLTTSEAEEETKATKWQILMHKLRKAEKFPQHAWSELAATAELVYCLGLIKRSEGRYLALYGGYVSDGSTWGDPFTQLDFNPNQNPHNRKWDYFVVATGGEFFVAEAWRRDGRYINASATLNQDGVYGGDYPYWFYVMLKRYAGS